MFDGAKLHLIIFFIDFYLFRSIIKLQQLDFPFFSPNTSIFLQITKKKEEEMLNFFFYIYMSHRYPMTELYL